MGATGEAGARGARGHQRCGGSDQRSPMVGARGGGDGRGFLPGGAPSRPQQEAGAVTRTSTAGATQPRSLAATEAPKPEDRAAQRPGSSSQEGAAGKRGGTVAMATRRRIWLAGRRSAAGAGETASRQERPGDRSLRKAWRGVQQPDPAVWRGAAVATTRIRPAARSSAAEEDGSAAAKCRRPPGDKFAIFVVSVADEAVFLRFNREYSRSKFDQCKYEDHISSGGICCRHLHSCDDLLLGAAIQDGGGEAKKLTRRSQGRRRRILSCRRALVIAFYAGPSLSPVNRHHRAFAAGAAYTPSPPRRGTWIIGTFLLVLSNGAWSLWIILQAALLTDYPNKMLVTAAQGMFSTVQTFVVASWLRETSLGRSLGLTSPYSPSFTARVCGKRSVLLPANMVPRDERACVPRRLEPAHLYAHSILLLVVRRRNRSSRQHCRWNLASLRLYSLLWGKNKESKITPRSRVITIDGAQDEQEQKKHQEKEEECKESEKETSRSATEQV
ncbi:hypothetical protein ACP70R_032895 [Stipagrostis hirtigluma subsp. patula]